MFFECFCVLRAKGVEFFRLKGFLTKYFWAWLSLVTLYFDAYLKFDCFGMFLFQN